MLYVNWPLFFWRMWMDMTGITSAIDHELINMKIDNAYGKKLSKDLP